MVKGKDIVACARTYIDTPFHHQGRVKGVGIDCAGVIIGIGDELGLTNFTVTGYSRSPSENLIRKYLNEHFDEIPVDFVKEGDILLFCFDKEPQHVAIYTGENLIHAFMQVRKCVEHSYDDLWKARTRGAYRYRGIE